MSRSLASWSPLRLTRFIARINAIRRMRPLDDPDRLLEFFEPPSLGGIFKPLQQPVEIRTLFLRVKDLRPKAVLEIGTNNGGSLFLFCRAADPDATVLSLDLPSGKFGGGYSILRVPYYRAFAGSGQRLRLLRQDSHTPEALARVRRELRGQPLEFLFIDGDHTYDGVKQDFLTYGSLVRPGGLIGFHDILPAPPKIGGEVHRFWGEIRDQYAGEEIVQDQNQGKMGIGLIRVPPGGVVE